MSDTITLTSEDAIRLWAGEETYAYKQYDQVHIGEWRWGFEYQLIIQDKLTERIYAADIKTSVGDNYYLSWEDVAQVVFVEVIRIERIEYSYRTA